MKLMLASLLLTLSFASMAKEAAKISLNRDIQLSNYYSGKASANGGSQYNNLYCEIVISQDANEAGKIIPAQTELKLVDTKVEIREHDSGISMMKTGYRVQIFRSNEGAELKLSCAYNETSYFTSLGARKNTPSKDEMNAIEFKSFSRL